MHSSFLKLDEFDTIFLIDYNSRHLPVYVRIRPYAEEFLRQMSENFEIVIFTASIAAYADKVIDLIDPDKTVKYRLF